METQPQLRIETISTDLATEILKIIDKRYTHKWMRLLSQIQASATSVAHCISEGDGWTTTGEKLRMISFSNGSLRETITCIKELQSVNIFTEVEAKNFILRYRRLSFQLMMVAASLLDNDPNYNGAYRKLAERGVRLRTAMREKQKNREIGK